MNYCVASCMGLMTISHREKNILVFSREIDFFSKNIVKKKQILIFFRIRLYTLAFHDIRPFL